MAVFSVPCRGCGSFVQDGDERAKDEYSSDVIRCRHCEEEPRLRLAYAAGFNAGLDALKNAVVSVAENSRLRKRQNVAE